MVTAPLGSTIYATGQFGAGRLSQADTRTTTQSVGDSLKTRFGVSANGRVGSIVDKQDPFIAFSDKFGEKASKSGVSVSRNRLGVSQLTSDARTPVYAYTKNGQSVGRVSGAFVDDEEDSIVTVASQDTQRGAGLLMLFAIGALAFMS